MRIPRKKIIITLCLVAIVLITISVLGQIYKFTLNDGNDRYLTTVFDLDREHNIPTYFSTIMLLICSLLFIVIGESKNDFEGRYRWHWTILGIIFFGLAIDEMLSFHEKTIEPLRNLLNTSGLLYHAWVIPAGLFLLALAFWYRKFLAEMPTRFRRLFILSGLIYVIGAMGIEMIGGLIISRYDQNNLTYALLTNFEEFFEIFGIILLIHALFSYVASLGGVLTFKIE